MFKAEQKFYLNDKMKYVGFDFDNKEKILKKLHELEKEGYL